MTGIANMRRVVEKATGDEIIYGQSAYVRYHEAVKHVADSTGNSMETACAVFCALSPQNNFYGTLRSCLSVLHWAGRIPDERITVTTYHHARARALRYLRGEEVFPSQTRGRKTLSFYDNILNPNTSLRVTVDGHILNIWENQPSRRLNQCRVTSQKYDEIEMSIIEEAQQFSCSPCDLQAILWFTWKRLHRIGYSGQADLFDGDGAMWKEITWSMKPFPAKALTVK